MGDLPVTHSKFPLIPLQAKLGGAMFLNHDTARLSIPQIYAPLWRNNQHGNFCQNDDPQTLTQYVINAGQRQNRVSAFSGGAYVGYHAKIKNYL